MVFWSIIALLVLALVLSFSADAVVKSVTYFAHRFRIQSFVLGFLILGFATTIPEMFVAYQAIADGVPQLSVGNLLGGSILLLSLVMGVGALILGRIVLDHGMTTKDIGLSSLVVAAPAIALWDGKLTRIEGVVLILIYLIHVVFLSKEQHVVGKVEHEFRHIKHAGHAVMFLLGGLVGLAVSSRFIVMIGEGLAKSFGLSPFVIGLFLITLGTNLPEFTLVYKAIVQKKRDVAFGDVLGSAVINTPILGIVCMIAPFSVPDYLRMRVTLVLLAMVSVFFFWAASTKRDVTRREGILLLTVYVAFVLFEFLRI